MLFTVASMVNLTLWCCGEIVSLIAKLFCYEVNLCVAITPPVVLSLSFM